MHVIVNPVEGTQTIFALWDKETNKPLLDNICPVQCGDCCKYWVEAEELRHLVVDPRMGVHKCPYLRETGCRLKRPKMPQVCKAYMCELGMLAYEKKVTKEEIARIVATNMHDRACNELGRPLTSAQPINPLPDFVRRP